MRKLWVLLLCCVFFPALCPAQNNSISGRHPARADKTTAVAAPVEISVSYSALRTNASPRQCGCFWMNGGSAEVAFHAYRWFSAVADLTGERSGKVNGGPQGLSLVSFTVGPRFTYPIYARYAPFVQTLFGAAHGFDSYFPVVSGPTGASNGFAMLAGGGLDVRMKSYLAIRPLQVDYLLTQLPNGANGRQNSLRLSAGIVLRFWQ